MSIPSLHGARLHRTLLSSGVDSELHSFPDEGFLSAENHRRKFVRSATWLQRQWGVFEEQCENGTFTSSSSPLTSDPVTDDPNTDTPSSGVRPGINVLVAFAAMSMSSLLVV